MLLVRALAGMWTQSELPLLPSRNTVALLALGSLLAAVPMGIDAGVQFLTLH